MTKDLIEENNVKRKKLTKSNEEYYNNLLMYIRLQITLSERSTEEVLMEMLDHLLEGQEEGKTAEEIFGDNPKGYADELIGQLPKEKKRDLFQFGTQIITNVLGWLLVIRGLFLLIISQFMEVDERIYLYSSLALVGAISVVMALMVWIFFKLINKTIFKKEKKSWKNEVLVGLSGALLAVGVMVVTYLFKEQGPTILFPWYWSVVVGGGLWLVSRVIQRKVESK